MSYEKRADVDAQLFRTPIDRLRADGLQFFQGSRFPSSEWLPERVTAVYGAWLRSLPNGEIIYDIRGAMPALDRSLDGLVRHLTDDHVPKNPFALLTEHPQMYVTALLSGPHRGRGDAAAIVGNIDRLGLGHLYLAYPNATEPYGIKLHSPELYKGPTLEEVWKADLIGHPPILRNVSRLELLAAGTQYISQLHARNGAAGELLANDIIFGVNTEGGLSDPFLTIPDIMYQNPKKTTEDSTKAMELLEFIISMVIEEQERVSRCLVRAGDEDEIIYDSIREPIGNMTIATVIDTVLANYADKNVIRRMTSLILRGRLSLEGDFDGEKSTYAPLMQKLGNVMSFHNQARLRVPRDFAQPLRSLILDRTATRLAQD